MIFQVGDIVEYTYKQTMFPHILNREGIVINVFKETITVDYDGEIRNLNKTKFKKVINVPKTYLSDDLFCVE